ncbi:hypothetical protein CLAIMM_01722 [Cladophialophora immunda]|nr:hypothetical protein CLAIMM_01722 [Cladophialophora immunda]
MTGELHHDTVQGDHASLEIHPISSQSDHPTSLDLERTPTISIRDHRTDDKPDLVRIRSAISAHDIQGVPSHDSSFVEVNAAQYERFSERRKLVITCVLSLCGFLAPISSTTILSAIPEVAATYNTDGTIINLSNALYLIFMGLSPSFGVRSPTSMAADGCTSFLIVGNSCLGDIYTPTARATALGWFLSGTLIGPAFGPFIGGIIVTFRSWRDIFWLQSALGGLAAVLVILFLPETIPEKKIHDLREYSRPERTVRILHCVSPFRTAILLFSYPNLIIAGLASSALVWNMYGLLTPIRYVLNPRFHLTSPIQSGLFYIAPGCGYLLGTFFGGRWADHIVKKWIRKKNRRVAEDRLRSCYGFIGGVVPACMLIYGWSVEKAVGGVPLPVAAMFVQGVAQLFCFPSLNTYCLDVMQSKGRSAEVVAGNYMIRYAFAAAGSAVCLPAIEAIGVGWFSTISSVFLVISAVGVWATTVWGESWRHAVDDRKKKKRKQREEEKAKEKGGKEGV